MALTRQRTYSLSDFLWVTQDHCAYHTKISVHNMYNTCATTHLACSDPQSATCS